jgi:hypothetical protein
MTTTPNITTRTLTTTSTTTMTTARLARRTTGTAPTRPATHRTAPAAATGRLLGVPTHPTTREVIDDPTRADT